MADRVAIMDEHATGIGNHRGLRGRRPNTNPLRLYQLPRVKTTSEYAPKTWAVIKSRKSSWGIGATTIYAQVAPNYTYIWYIDKNMFEVHNDLQAVTTYYGINSIHDLPVSWAVFKSSQFLIKISTESDNDSQLVASRSMGNREYHDHSYKNSVNPYLDEFNQHAVYDMLSFMNYVVASINNGKPYNNLNLTATVLGRDILTSYTGDFLESNDFSTQIIGVEEILYANRLPVTRPGMCLDRIHFLLIALFSNNLLSNGTAIVLEPWMLWRAFEWYCKPVINNKTKRQIFDISPRW